MDKCSVDDHQSTNQTERSIDQRVMIETETSSNSSLLLNETLRFACFVLLSFGLFTNDIQKIVLSLGDEIFSRYGRTFARRNITRNETKNRVDVFFLSSLHNVWVYFCSFPSFEQSLHYRQTRRKRKMFYFISTSGLVPL
jgi:hypothetical protein